MRYVAERAAPCKSEKGIDKSVGATHPGAQIEVLFALLRDPDGVLA
jgi:hypothetical protein